MNGQTLVCAVFIAMIAIAAAAIITMIYLCVEVARITNWEPGAKEPKRKKGHWKKGIGGEYICSRCDATIDARVTGHFYYCPYCGAKMEWPYGDEYKYK